MVPDGGEPTEDSDERAADGSAGDASRVDDPPADDPEADDSAAEDSTEDESTANEPTDEEIVAAASDAAEGVVFSRYRRSDVRDVDVAVSFEGGVLEVDVYLNVPDADFEEHVDEEAERVADDAALAAIDAVDRLFEAHGA